MKRRDFIKKTIFAGALIYAPEFFPNNKINNDYNLLRFPPELLPGETLKFNSSDVEIWHGTLTKVLSLNGSYPSPTIRIKKNEEFSTVFENHYSEDATIHWHGLEVPEIMDGQPKNAVNPGKSHTYKFPIIQRAGTYFYHSHAHHNTAKHVYMGFAGFFIIEDPEESALGIPGGKFDIPLLIQDRHSIYQPAFVYSPTMMDKMIGYLGDVPLMNGTPNALLEVHKTLYRFRMVNGSNARIYNLFLSDNSRFWILATDSGLVSELQEVQYAVISPGERLDILIDFSKMNLGQSVSLNSAGLNDFGGQDIQMELLRFKISGSESSSGTIPINLPDLNYFDNADVQRIREFTLSQGMMMGSGIHRINGLTYEMDRIDEYIPFNELEEWRFINNTNNYHPMHIHGTSFQIYSRNGNKNHRPEDEGFKDTVLIGPNENVSILIKFNAYTGKYLLHCHNLEHEDDGMMLNLQVDSSTSVDNINEIPDEFELFQNFPNPFNSSTVISYHISTKSPSNLIFVSLMIYDILGKTAAVLVSEYQTPGNYEISWNAEKYPSGIYFCELTCGNNKSIKKMQLLK